MLPAIQPQPLARKQSPILVHRQFHLLDASLKASGTNLLRRVELIDVLQQIRSRRYHHAPSRVHSTPEQQRAKCIPFAKQHKRPEKDIDRKRLGGFDLTTFSVASRLFFPLAVQYHTISQDCPQKSAVGPAFQRQLAVACNSTKCFWKHQEDSDHTQSRKRRQEPKDRSPAHRTGKEPTNHWAQSQAELSHW